MKTLADVLQCAGVTAVALAALIRGVGAEETPPWRDLHQGVLEGVKGADPYKRVLKSENCDSNNAGQINNGGSFPGVTGPVVASCTDGNGEKCIMCISNVVGPLPPNQVVGTSTTVYTPPGLRNPTSSACGDLHGGRCLNVAGSGPPNYECVDEDGLSHGTCADSIYWQLQPAGN